MGNPFEGMEKEDLSGSGNGIYFVPGEYPLLQIQQCKFKEAGDTFKGSDVFIALIEVIQSKVESRPPGTVIEYVVKKKLPDGSPNPFYFKNIKKLLMAAFNTEDPADVDQDLMTLVITEKQAAASKFISAVATNTTTQKGKPFTNVDWKPSSGPGKTSLASKALAEA